MATLQGLALTQGTVFMPPIIAVHTKTHSLASLRRPHHAKVSFPFNENSWSPFPKLVVHCKGPQNPCLSSASSPLLRGGLGSLSHTIPKLSKRHQCNLTPQASKYDPYSNKYPPTTEKPKWWWRSLACLPYLLLLHDVWMYAETSYHLHPFLEDFEVLTSPILGVIEGLPSWFMMAYFLIADFGIVRRKECPHFFRFHLVMSMALKVTLQVVGVVSHWMPLSVYWGKVGMHFWAAVAFAYLFTIFECMRCALAGKYTDVPFISEAAYMHIPYS